VLYTITNISKKYGDRTSLDVDTGRDIKITIGYDATFPFCCNMLDAGGSKIKVLTEGGRNNLLLLTIYYCCFKHIKP